MPPSQDCLNESRICLAATPQLRKDSIMDSIHEMNARIADLPDDGLIEMLELRPADYTEEALRIARVEASRRGGLEAMKKRIMDMRKMEQTKEATREFSMPHSINGCGTMYYGKEDFMSDNSYLTTLWFTLLFVPICPLRLDRVVDLDWPWRAEFGLLHLG